MSDEKQNQQLRDLLDDCLYRHFGVQDAAFQRFVDDHANFIDLTTGDVLITQGEICDAVYFLLSGHLRAIVDTPEGTSIPVGDIGRGETVGELALFTGKPRGANVVAIRDSIAAKIPSDVLEKAISKQPQVAIKITRQIIERFERAQAGQAPPLVPATVTVLPISPGVDVEGFTRNLAAVRQDAGEDIRVINCAYVRHSLGGLEAPDVALPRGNVSLAISAMELESGGLFFAADPSDRAWCHTAVHHSDEVLLIANAGAEPSVSEIENDLLKGHQNLRAQTTLVLVHDETVQSPTGTAKWLDARNVSRHIHIRKNNKSDLRRLSRIIAGQARGLVLAGGGARGMAHLGIMEAMGEAGLEFDFIGGTSAGAIMGSFAALGVAPENLKDVTRDIFVNSPFGNISGDYNPVPMVSLIKGKRAFQVTYKAILDNAGGDIDIEDSLKTFFTIASNFTRHREEVLSRGNFVRNVLASFSIPGLMPPVIMNGNLMFDGGSFNNFPVDHMRKLGARHIVGIDLLPDVVRLQDVDSAPGTRALLRDKLRPAKKRRYAKLPSLANTLLTASVSASMARQKEARSGVDILIQPNTRGVSLLDWKKYDMIFERAKKDAAEQLNSLDAQVLDKFRDS